MRGEEMKISCLHRMLPVRSDGSKEFYDMMEHAGTFESLKARIERRIMVTRN